MQEHFLQYLFSSCFIYQYLSNAVPLSIPVECVLLDSSLLPAASVCVLLIFWLHIMKLRGLI